MRYRPEHKDLTRRRIVQAAARLFRRHGYDGVGVDAVMAEAGLTRGGFYGYFRSKRALFAEALGLEYDLLTRLRARVEEDPDGLRRQGCDVLAAYLAPANRAKVARGCEMTALSADVARADKGAKRAYTRNVGELVAELARGVEGRPDAERRAMATLAACVGGLIIAHAVDDAELADAICEASRSVAEDLLGSG